MVCSFLALPCVMQAQDDVTNAFDDLKRQGTVNEQDSEMRRVASSDAVKRLIQENPEAGYFCFTEDREHDIRMTDARSKGVENTSVSDAELLKELLYKILH